MSRPAGLQPRVVLHPLHAPRLDEVMSHVAGIELVNPANDDRVAEEMEGGASVLVTMRWDERFLSDGLRWVQATSAGVEQFPLESLRARHIVLTSAQGSHAPSVALHAIALLLALVRGVAQAAKDAPDRLWRPKPAYELAGRTLGVLGLGLIGEEVAQLAVALGMKVIGTKRDPAGYCGIAEQVLGPEFTVEVCAQADAVVIALPATVETEQLIDADALDALGNGWLVNVGRGSVIDEIALERALRDGPLRGAGLDVVRDEPLAESSPLWDLPNVVITPHMAWSSDRLTSRLLSLFETNLEAYLSRTRWTNRIV
jgi:D-2-hydroxyacid dehydrogenase (NADP+)